MIILDLCLGCIYITCLFVGSNKQTPANTLLQVSLFFYKSYWWIGKTVNLSAGSKCVLGDVAHYALIHR